MIIKVDRNRKVFDDVDSALSIVTDWFTSNNLVLNAKNAKCIKFALPNIRNLGPNIVLGNDDLETVKSTLFLGVTYIKPSGKTQFSRLRHQKN